MVVRRAAIDDHMAGGWDGVRELVPNDTQCADEELVRVGFLARDHVEKFVDSLVRCGLVFLEGGKSVDISVVDQQSGPMAATPWLQYAHLRLSGGERKVATCWLFEGPRNGHGQHMKALQSPLATPSGWRYEGSLSESFQFRPSPREVLH